MFSGGGRAQFSPSGSMNVLSGRLAATFKAAVGAGTSGGGAGALVNVASDLVVLVDDV